MDSTSARAPIIVPDWYAQKYGAYSEDERTAFMKNPLYLSHAEKGDFTPFYATIAICTIFAFALIILNVFYCWCSSHKYYWRDPNTGNRWIQSIWTLTPYKQPPLDLTELEEVATERRANRVVYETSEIPENPQSEYLELHKRESDL